MSSIQASFGYRALLNRLTRALAECPEVSSPQASQYRAALKVVYRFFDSKYSKLRDHGNRGVPSRLVPMAQSRSSVPIDY